MGRYYGNVPATNNVPKKEVKEVKVMTSEGEKNLPIDSVLEFEPTEMPTFGKTARYNSKDLAAMIKAKFQNVFHDCCGAYIGWDGNHFLTTLYFKDNPNPIPEGKIKNLINLTNNVDIQKTTNIFEKQKALQSRSQGKIYQLNNATKLYMSSYMYGGRKANHFNNISRWNQSIIERRRPVNAIGILPYNAEEIVIGITNLDLRVICHDVLFGKTMVTRTNGNNENVISNYARYECRYSKPMPDGSFMINIEQFDQLMVDELSKKEAPVYPGYGNGGIVMF